MPRAPRRRAQQPTAAQPTKRPSNGDRSNRARSLEPAARIVYSGNQIVDVTCNNMYLSGNDPHAIPPRESLQSSFDFSTPSPPPASLGTVDHWKRVRSSRRGMRCPLASLGLPVNPGKPHTIEDTLFEYCCTMNNSKVKRSLLASFIVDCVGPRPRAFHSLWDKIIDCTHRPPEDDFPAYITDLINGINDSSDATSTPLQRLKAACKTTMDKYYDDDNDVYSCMAHCALNQMYMNFRFTKMQDLPFLGEKSFAVRFPFWDISLQTVDGLRINHGEIRSTSHTQKSDCTFSLPYGHDKMLDIGMAEFGRFCTGGTTSTKWITDSHKTFLAMRDMLSFIHAAVDGDPGVMRRIQVFGIVGSGIIYQVFFMTALIVRKPDKPQRDTAGDKIGEVEGMQWDTSDVCVLQRGPVCKVPNSIEEIDQLAEIMKVALQLRAVAQANEKVLREAFLSKKTKTSTNSGRKHGLSFSFRFHSV